MAAAGAVEVAVALGANLGSVAEIRARFEAVARALEAWAVGPVRVSPLYRSRAVGPVRDQPDFVNAVAVLAARAPDPEALLAELLAIEARFGRVRDVAGGPRPLDLDLLWVGDLRVDTPALTLPHPRYAERRFVLAPLCDLLGPERVPPGQARPLAELLRASEPAAIERLTP